MDFIGGLPKAMGKDTILVVVDRFTKYAHFIALSHPYHAKEVAEVFIKDVVKLHGFPTSIVSDRDKVNFLKHILVRVVQASWYKIEIQFCLSPTNRWAN